VGLAAPAATDLWTCGPGQFLRRLQFCFVNGATPIAEINAFNVITPLLNTVLAVCGGCLTGPGHSGAQLHGFLAYLVRCAVSDRPYVVFGYAGKQVRDNIHSFDLVNAFWRYFDAPRSGEVYNIGGGRYCNCSMLEAIEKCQNLTGRKMRWSYSDANRAGDHIWWISDIRRFQVHYPGWSMRYDLDAILREIFDAVSDRALRSEVA
jgi:CDP-paratose 2-epimerase